MIPSVQHHVSCLGYSSIALLHPSSIPNCWKALFLSEQVWSAGEGGSEEGFSRFGMATFWSEAMQAILTSTTLATLAGEDNMQIPVYEMVN